MVSSPIQIHSSPKPEPVGQPIAEPCPKRPKRRPSLLAGPIIDIRFNTTESRLKQLPISVWILIFIPIVHGPYRVFYGRSWPKVIKFSLVDQTAES